MILKQTLLSPSDLCGVWTVRVFHLYRGFNRKCTRIGEFIKISVRVTKARNWFKRKKKSVAIVLRSRYMWKRFDGATIRFRKNNCILLKRRMTPRGGQLYGPVPSKLRRRKFMLTFPGML